MFLRKSSDRRDPLPVTMSGVRMGERVLQLGAADAAVAGAIAAKVGMSGTAVIVAADERAAARARAGADKASAIADVQVAAPAELSRGLAEPPVSAADGSFDVVVIDLMDGWLSSLPADARLATLRECLRVLRPGGRIVTLEPGTKSGLGTLFGGSRKVDAGYEAAGGTVMALQTAGFKPARLLADEAGYKFCEGLKT